MKLRIFVTTTIIFACTVAGFLTTLFVLPLALTLGLPIVGSGATAFAAYFWARECQIRICRLEAKIEKAEEKLRANPPKRNSPGTWLESNWKHTSTGKPSVLAGRGNDVGRFRVYPSRCRHVIELS
jgi:hypothetical protein